jgi:hypothetical protein
MIYSIRDLQFRPTFLTVLANVLIATGTTDLRADLEATIYTLAAAGGGQVTDHVFVTNDSKVDEKCRIVQLTVSLVGYDNDPTSVRRNAASFTSDTLCSGESMFIARRRDVDEKEIIAIHIDDRGEIPIKRLSVNKMIALGSASPPTTNDLGERGRGSPSNKQRAPKQAAK